MKVNEMSELEREKAWNDMLQKYPTPESRRDFLVENKNLCPDQAWNFGEIAWCVEPMPAALLQKLNFPTDAWLTFKDFVFNR